MTPYASYSVRYVSSVTYKPTCTYTNLLALCCSLVFCVSFLSLSFAFLLFCLFTRIKRTCKELIVCRCFIYLVFVFVSLFFIQIQPNHFCTGRFQFSFLRKSFDGVLFISLEDLIGPYSLSVHFMKRIYSLIYGIFNLIFV